MTITTNENWAAVASVYLQHVERLTLPPTQSLLSHTSALLPLSTPASSALDNGSGTGVLTSLLAQQHPTLPLLATDASPGMISTLQRRIEAQNWTAVTARVVDGRNLEGIKDGSFTHTFSTFMVCLAPEPEKIVREMRRVTREGGVLGLAVWGDPRFGPFTKPWERACREQVPDYEQPVLMDAEWTLGGNVRAGLERAGFRDVEVWEEECVWGWESAEGVGERGGGGGVFFRGGQSGEFEDD